MVLFHIRLALRVRSSIFWFTRLYTLVHSSLIVILRKRLVKTSLYDCTVYRALKSHEIVQLFCWYRKHF